MKASTVPQVYRWLMLAAGGVCGAAFFVARSPGASAALLFFGSGIVAMSLGQFASATAMIPVANLRRAASAVAMLSSGIYYLVHGGSKALLVLAWIGVVWGGLGFFNSAKRVIGDFFALKGVFLAFQEGKPLSIGIPLVYVVGEPGLGNFVGNRLAAQIAQALFRYRYRSGGSVLAEGERIASKYRFARRLKVEGRLLAHFLVSDSTRQYSSEFRDWLVRHVSALVIVKLDGPVASGPSPTSEREEYYRQATDGSLLCPGPTSSIGICLQAAKTTETLGAHHKEMRADLNLRLNWGPSVGRMEDVIAPVVDCLAATAIPLAIADSNLAETLRATIPQLAESGMPPISDAYLRVRRARSDVERFLASMDAIEVMIRLSVLVSIIDLWSHTNLISIKELIRPTLGNWVSMLRRLSELAGKRPKMCAEIQNLWQLRTWPCQHHLMATAAQHELPLEPKRDVTQLEWLAWFTEFRNTTKGHGIIEERGVAFLWANLHETFVTLCAHCRWLALDSGLMVQGDDGHEYRLMGWMRNGRRVSPGPGIRFPDGVQRPILRVATGGSVHLYPFLAVEARSVLVWDGMDVKEQQLQMLNYSEGRRQEAPLLVPNVADAFDAWTRANKSPESGPG